MHPTRPQRRNWLMKFSIQTQIITAKPNQNPSQLLVSLNSLIAQFTRSHQNSQALQLFNQIQSSHHLKPDHYTLTTTLTACANLCDSVAGEQLHAHIIRTGFRGYTHIDNSLLSFYAKLKNINSLCQVFDEMPNTDIYSWTTLLSAYTKMGRIDFACRMLDRVPQRNSAAVWNAIITGCVEQGFQNIAFDMFCRMHRMGVWHDQYTYASVLRACCSPELLDLGKQVHSLVIRTGFLVWVSVVNSLLSMYFDFGLIRDAYGVFEETMVLNQITYNAMIAGLVGWGRDLEALMMYKEMGEAGFGPTELTFVSALSACSSDKMTKMGSQIHAQAVKMGFEATVLVSNAMITMYSSRGDLLNALLVFERLEEKDLVSWNSMIAGYAQGNYFELAISVYLRMQRAGIEPDDFTFGSLLSCSNVENAEMLQALVAKNGLISNTQVGNALVSAFSKCGHIEHAYLIFGEMPSINLISWNSILSGLLLNGFPLMCLEMFYKLQMSEFKPNIYTLSIVLSTCACISDLRHGKQIHAYILRSGFDSETSLGNALITMYSKCGVLNWSFEVFHGMLERDAVSWNAMVAAYAQHGKGKESIHCLKAMKESGIEPDPVTFTIVLSACSHAGLVDEGRWIFSSMVEDYAVERGVDHYCCIIDLLGRAGHLDEAERLINSMPFPAESHIWWALLGACRAHCNVRLGRIAAGFLLEIEPDNPAVYVFLSNIYAAAGQWEEAASVRELMRKNGVIKKPGCSWMESQNHTK
ncbi:tetratricopeptide repeat (TPR)-like superfamily protein [Tasmannia lanceolata]|uniref:tetratricopeptide repeat (TPR)-like superfamily protein n=1 Tax=Tasmannia lanceolata TaxID=3420 RepID=UPI0040636C82